MSKILWIVGGGEGFGVRRATLGMAGALREMSFRICFVALNSGQFADEIGNQGFEIHVLHDSPAQMPKAAKRSFFSNVVQHLRGQWKHRRRLTEIAADFQPEWIHLRHNNLLVLAGLTARATGLPAYWHLPNTIGQKLPCNLQAISYQLFCRWAGVLPMGNSQHTADSLGYRFVDTKVLRLGIDEKYFSPSAEFPRLNRLELALEDGYPVYAIIARVVPEKAQDRVLEAFIELLADGEKVHLLIVGGPAGTDYYSSLKRRIAEAGVGWAVKLLEAVTDPRPYFAISDVIINSRTGPEPFGLTIVEAMLMERPVLAYRAGGPGESVLDGETGWLIDSATVSAYKAGIKRTLQERAKWSQIGGLARRHAIVHYSIRAVATKYVELVGRHRQCLN